VSRAENVHNGAPVPPGHHSVAGFPENTETGTDRLVNEQAPAGGNRRGFFIDRRRPAVRHSPPGHPEVEPSAV